MAIAVTTRRVLEPVLAQGLIEKAFPDGLEACTERVRFSKEDRLAPFDGGLAMKRGLLAGAAAEQELHRFASGSGFSIDLGELVDRLIQRQRLGGFPPETLADLRTAVIGWVRRFQASFPPEDDGLNWSEATALLRPQTDLFLWRKDRFRIRVRPDLVVGIDDTLAAVEFSTAKDPASISDARFALNHHALVRERLRRDDWERFESVATRVEMLSLGYGFTVRLDAGQAEEWRLAIGQVAEVLVSGQYAPNPGEYCSACPWQLPCRFGAEPIKGEGF